MNQSRMRVFKEIPHSKFINCIDWAKNGTLIATGDIDGHARIFDINNKEDKFVLSNHGLGVKAIKFSDDSKSVITGGEDLHINICDVETKKRLGTWVSHSDWVTSLSFHPFE